MKIAMIYPHISSEKGISAYTSNLIRNLRSQGGQIQEIDFISGNPNSLLKKFSLLKKCKILHFQHEYNLFGYFGIPYFFFLGWFKFLANKRIIVTMHTVLSQKEEFNAGRLKNFLRKFLYQTQNRWIGLTSKKIVVHADAFKEILIKEYSIFPNKIVVLPHAIIEDIKTSDKSNSKKELKLNGKVYLLIGSMVPDHGHDIILRQAGKIDGTILVATNPSAVNDRNENKILNFLEINRKIVKENGFQNVRFDLGEISYEKWWKYFSAADIILLPYQGGIGSGIFADAMAMKKPVVASDIRYFREFAKKYGCIKLAKEDRDFPKEISKAMIPKNYKKMEAEAKRYFKENGLTPISKKYIKLYKNL
ncbi:glycosyltransferase family 4 protein [archaeon]|jgi:glycosyltransferase involved in cell wall biosynthesis|nr:glycosyltransferase family 4 protein [archaeon]